MPSGWSQNERLVGEQISGPARATLHERMSVPPDALLTLSASDLRALDELLSGVDPEVAG